MCENVKMRPVRCTTHSTGSKDKNTNEEDKKNEVVAVRLCDGISTLWTHWAKRAFTIEHCQDGYQKL